MTAASDPQAGKPALDPVPRRIPATARRPGLPAVRGLRGGLTWQRGLIGAALLAAVGFAGIKGYERLHPAPKTTAAVQTAPATRRSIVESVTLPGTVNSGRTSKLSFASSSSGASISGVVKSISVKTGDTVKAGQVVAQLDTTALDLSVQTAQSSLAVANLKMQQLLAGALSSDIASAEQSVISASGAILTAQSNLATAQTTLDGVQSHVNLAAQAAAAQQAADRMTAQGVAAQAAIDAALGPAYANTDTFETKALRSAINDLVNTVSARCSVLSARDTCSAIATTSGSDLNALVTALNAQTTGGQDLAAPLAAFNTAASSTNVPAVREPVRLLVQATAARAGLVALANNLVFAQSGPAGSPTADVVANAVRSRDVASQALDAAKAAYSAAVARRNQTVGGPLPTDVALQEQSIAQATISVQRAMADRAAASLTAPYDGVIGAITMNAGEQSGSGSIVLIDQTAMQLQASSQESDIAKLKPGQVASLTFDAYPGVTVPGTVISVAPDATVTQGVASYSVVIGVNNAAIAASGGASGAPGAGGTSGATGARGTGASGATGARGAGPGGATGANGATGAGGGQTARASLANIILRSGMTGTGVVEIQRHDNVLTVPSKAVKRQGRNSIVTVLVDGAQQVKTVTIGTTDGTYTEITSGLNEGDVVVTSATAPAMTGATTATGATAGAGATGAVPGGIPAGGPGFGPGFRPGG